MYVCMRMQGTQSGRAKSMQAQCRKNGPASQRKPKERFKRCRDAPAVLLQACEVNLDSHEQCKDICTASGSVQDPGRNPRHPRTSKLTYFRTAKNYTRKAARLAFVSGNVDSWGVGSGLRAHIHMHDAEAALHSQFVLVWPQNY